MSRTAIALLLLALLQDQAPPLTIEPSKLRPAVVGKDYFEQIKLSSPIHGVTWLLNEGELPDGIELIGQQERALLVGRPTISTPQPFRFTVSAWGESGLLAQSELQLLVQPYEPQPPANTPNASPGSATSGSAPDNRPAGVTGQVLDIVDSALKMAEGFARSGAENPAAAPPDGSAPSPTELPPSEPPEMRPKPKPAEPVEEPAGAASASIPEPEPRPPQPPTPQIEPPPQEPPAGAGVGAKSPEEIAWQMLAASEAEYQKLRSYQCLFIKQERSPSGLGPEERIQYSFRKPFSVRMEWIAGPHKGRKAVYVQGQNDDQLLVREGGLLGLITVKLDPRGSTAMRGEHHPITESGIGEALRLIRENFRRGRNQGEVAVELLGEKQQGGRSLRGFKATFSPRAKPPYYSAKAEVWVDLENKLPYMIIAYDERDRVYERYVFSELQINPTLAGQLFKL